MGPCFESYLPYRFALPEMICDQAKMNLASHRVQRLSGNYSSPAVLLRSGLLYTHPDNAQPPYKIFPLSL